MNQHKDLRRILADSDDLSLLILRNFVRTRLEHDMARFGTCRPAETMRRFWIRLAHNQAQISECGHIGLCSANTTRIGWRYLNALQNRLVACPRNGMGSSAGNRGGKWTRGGYS